MGRKRIPVELYKCSITDTVTTTCIIIVTADSFYTEMHFAVASPFLSDLTLADLT